MAEEKREGAREEQGACIHTPRLEKYSTDGIVTSHISKAMHSICPAHIPHGEGFQQRHP